MGCAVDLYKYQKDAVDKLKSGSILVGGVGSGKSRAALFYFFAHVRDNTDAPNSLYIFTTARKRDTREWEAELEPFDTSTVEIHIDSWNNIAKYTLVKDAFVIFDEQRVIGNGVWVKSFLKIVKNNEWILLSATPGDSWMDYIPVFIANGWYKNRTEFIRRHVVYKHFNRYPQIDHYVEVSRLVKLRDAVVVNMRYSKPTTSHDETLKVPFDKDLMGKVQAERWHVYEKRPVRDVSELCYLMRRVVNSDPRRIHYVSQLLEKHPKVIVFYNFNYERELLLKLGERLGVPVTEWSGHKHQAIPTTDNWMYIVQYAAGAEGWNCVHTNVIIFYSQNYSYKTTVQAAGRIDRLNTPFTDLYYYHLSSNSAIDMAIQNAFNNKKNFNEQLFNTF